MNATTETGNVHLGRNIKRIREMLQIKQQTLANHLGDDWSQKKISQLEDKEVIDDELLAQVAKALNVPVEAIKEFDEAKTVNIVANTFTDFNDNASAINYSCELNFNPIDKLMEAMDKNEQLYERLLQAEKEKVELMKQVLEKGK